MADRDPRLQAAEALAMADRLADAVGDWWEDNGPEGGSLGLAQRIYDALTAGGDVIVTRPVCGTCGGSGHRDVEYNLCQTEARTAESAAAIADIMHAAARKLAPCPDCVDGKLPTEVIRVEPGVHYMALEPWRYCPLMLAKVGDDVLGSPRIELR